MIEWGKIHLGSIVCLFFSYLKLPVEYLFDIFHSGKLNLSVWFVFFLKPFGRHSFSDSFCFWPFWSQSYYIKFRD